MFVIDRQSLKTPKAGELIEEPVCSSVLISFKATGKANTLGVFRNRSLQSMLKA